ncbi:MAG: sigma 54-interacting transcriptional regulator [Myxococcaceae bacterium]
MASSDQETLRIPDKPRPAGPGKLRLVVLGEGVFSAHALPESGDVSVGRSEDVDVRIDERSISRRHAVLHLGAGLRLEDLGSANGTRVRERKLEPNETVDVHPGDLIEMGTVVLLVQREAASLGAAWQLHTHARFAERLEEECARAEGARREFAVIRLQVQGQVPAGSVQQILAPAVRPVDLVASYGPGEYEILAMDATPGAAEALLVPLVTRLRAQGANVRTGIACYPRDGRAPEPLLAACSAVSPVEGSSFVVRDDAMQRLHKLVERIAASSISVLLLGETGVGKEIIAGELHRLSKRAAGPFLRLNCAALSETLLESELFGHEKGSFTGAVRAKPGLLETAGGGTVLLDEVGELPPSIQAKLLRVLEERQVMRVGGLKAEPIDVRFVFATNRDLEAEVARGAFRQDLYYRLNGIAVVIPPLRERLSEIEPLARDFAAQAARRDGREATPALAQSGLDVLVRYPWPGNIRELRNVMERAVLLCGDGPITEEHLALGKPRVAVLSPPPPGLAVPAPDPQGAPNLKGEREAAERRVIADALEKCQGNQTKAAKMLGISRRTLVARLQAYGLARPRKAKAGGEPEAS